jgi:hypothetical protein
MHKIDYPTNLKELILFKNEYVNCLKVDTAVIDRHLNCILFNNIPLTFSELVGLPFGDLILVEPLIKTYISKQKKVRNGKRGKTTAFERLFNYPANQSNIASFFMKRRDLGIKTCCYCGIDYINSFTDLKDYSSALNFLNKADIYDLSIIPGIGDKVANKIISKRKIVGQFKNLIHVGLSHKVYNKVKDFKFDDGHNHFTLDHVLPQSVYKCFSLCLFNLVPSCYACNAKFKKANNFEINSVNRLSPTSVSYDLPANLKFKLLLNDGKKIENVKSVNDFIICNEINKNKADIEKYLRIFKINGRYVYHKDQILSLIQLKVRYSDSRIREISRQTGISQLEIKKNIFGDELFNKDLNKEPLVKLKRDIAIDLNIKNVIA